MSNDEKPQILAEGKFLRMLKVGRWEFVQRTRSSGAVHIVAVTDARELVLVEQMRVPVGNRTIELPAGIMGDSAAFANESPQESAMRELLEETGFQGASAQLLCSGPNAPGLTTERSNLVRVKGLKRVHAGGGDENENITVHLAPIDGIKQWLDRKQAEGLLVEPRIFAALYFILSES